MSDSWKSSYFNAFTDAGLSKWGVDGSPSLAQAKGVAGSPSLSSRMGKWGAFDPGYDLTDVLNKYAPQQPLTDPYQTGAAIGQMGTPSGGNWGKVNQWDPHVAKASAATGVPANVIKAIMMIESQGTLDAMSPMTSSGNYFGLMQIGATSAVPEYMKSQSWLRGNPYNQILAGATELKNKYAAIGAKDWTQAAGAYFGYGTDVTGTSTQGYMSAFNKYMGELGGSGGVGAPNSPTSTMGSLSSNAFVKEATKYVGVNYVWGGIPGASQNPWDTGWDCSGMTYFMDQKYGGGALPMGSHYQFDYAQRTGQLFTNLQQLQPGDLVFINTGWQGGAGANLNAAGHVGIYIGNGQMLHAANPSQGTIISPLSGYSNILGGMHMSWSGGTGGGYYGASSQPQQAQTPRSMWTSYIFGR